MIVKPATAPLSMNSVIAGMRKKLRGYLDQIEEWATESVLSDRLLYRLLY